MAACQGNRALKSACLEPSPDDLRHELRAQRKAELLKHVRDVGQPYDGKGTAGLRLRAPRPGTGVRRLFRALPRPTLASGRLPCGALRAPLRGILAGAAYHPERAERCCLEGVKSVPRRFPLESDALVRIGHLVCRVFSDAGVRRAGGPNSRSPENEPRKRPGGEPGPGRSPF